MQELNSLGFDERDVSSGGYKITTTLNYKAQKAADEAVRRYLRSYGLTKDKQQGAVYGISPLTGEILVYVGGKDYEKVNMTGYKTLYALRGQLLNLLYTQLPFKKDGELLTL
ncbi:MAG: hypothetical protein L6V95_05270 [Candidatus Melainabacteria bacterium]|nr:MAG: hypothetical protein L6V95_05270 [Candidatus Melainabacteria bacterium]